MKKKITPLNWEAMLEDLSEVHSIDKDFILINNISIMPVFDFPFKLDVTAAMICATGTIKGSINLTPYSAEAPCLVVILPDQILQYEYVSDDFSGHIILMSKRFSDSLLLNLQERMPLFFSISSNPFMPLNSEQLDILTHYYQMLQSTVLMKDNPYRSEIVKHLTQAFFYGTYHIFQGFLHNSRISGKDKKSKHELLLERFLNEVQMHYKQQRGIEFYAGKLCLTPKYLSKVVKETGGLSAGEWIDNYVMLEAKALLKSTNMTIQQISDELNFASQSFFGKYFKRHAGVSPKEYRIG